MIGNISQLAEIFAILVSVSAVFGKKFKINIYMAVLIIAELFLMTGINTYGFPVYLIILSYVGLYIYCLLSYNDTIVDTLKKLFLALIIVSILQLITYMPVTFLMSGNSGLAEIIINFGCMIIIGLGRKPINNFACFLVSNNKVMFIIYISILLGVGILLYNAKLLGGITGKDYIQIIYICILLYLVIKEWQKVRFDAERKKVQIEMNRLYYDAYDEVLSLVRERQHDMKNHINAILGMVHSVDNYDELVTEQKKYCNYVLKQNDNARLVSLIENPLIAGFLYRKLQEAEREGITVEYKVIVSKDNVSYFEYDIIEMLGILFDNAIEAVQGQQRTSSEKKIGLELWEKEKSLHISLSNTLDYYSEEIIEKMFDKGYSTKGVGRGIGLNKLKHMVKAHKGEIIVSNEKMENIEYIKITISIPI